MTVKHPNWRCPGCGAVMYYRGACHHAYGCGDHPGCEKYREAKYRASGMWPLNWSRERVQRASGKTRGDSAATWPRGLALFGPVALRVEATAPVVPGVVACVGGGPSGF